jgi:hypothetical protein
VIDADAALTFLSFVEQRHRAWERRTAGLPQETWTDDPIVATHKFTNVYRVLDYGSQFVLTDLIDPNLDERTQLRDLFLYRHTGRVEAWDYAAVVAEAYPYDLDELYQIWSAYRNEGRPFFTNAYLVFPQSTVPGTDKLRSIIDLTERLFTEGSPDDVVPDFLAVKTQQERFRVLRRNKGVADFMSMQVLTDWGYTPHCGEDRENEMVVCGPGAVKGARALGLDPDSAIQWAVTSLRNSGTVRLGDRLPSYMDVQNCLCEFSKYVRFAAKPIPAKPYKPAHPGLSTYRLPDHWQR